VGQFEKSIPQRLKPLVFVYLAARLKPCPFKTDPSWHGGTTEQAAEKVRTKSESGKGWIGRG
jgi:hypothetical protein